MPDEAKPGLRNRLKTWREKRAQKKEEKAEAGGKAEEAEGGKGKSVADMTGFRMPGSPMMKQAGKYGLWIGLALVLAVILFFLAFVIGGIFAALPLFIMLAILGALLAIGLLFKGKFGSTAVVIIIFVILAWGAWYLQYTPDGQNLVGQGQVFGVGTAQGFRAFAGPLNIMNQIFTGTYNPENLWRSDTIESQYETVTDVGVTIADVKPIREKFDINEPLVVQGRINAVAFPGQTANASLTAICTIESAVPGVKECKPRDAWTCEPKFNNIKEIRNRVFSCTHDSQNCEGAQSCVYPVDIIATAKNTWTVAGKQFVFANPNVAVTLENPLQTWGISKDSLNSWQKGDQSINLGIGVVNKPDYLEAGSNLDYYLGINVENPNKGTASITGVSLLVPKALFNNDCSTAANSDFKTCKDASAGDLSRLGLKTTAPLCDCTAGLAYGEDLKPGDKRVALLKLRIDKKQLYGADFGTFFVLATAKYNYENSQLVAVTVEKMGPS
jgi:hypothetical protein